MYEITDVFAAESFINLCGVSIFEHDVERHGPSVICSGHEFAASPNTTVAGIDIQPHGQRQTSDTVTGRISPDSGSVIV